MFDDNRGQKYGLQQNICYNIYRGLVYWAKNDIFDTIVTGKTKVFLAGIFADYRELIIKNDY